MGVRRGSKGEQMLPSGFGHMVKHMVKILKFCVIILTFGQKTNICSPRKNLLPLQKLLWTPMEETHPEFGPGPVFWKKTTERRPRATFWCIYNSVNNYLKSTSNFVVISCNPVRFRNKI